MTEFPKVPYEGTYRFVSDRCAGSVYQREMRLQKKTWWGWSTVASVRFDIPGQTPYAFAAMTDTQAANKALSRYIEDRSAGDRKVYPA